MTPQRFAFAVLLIVQTTLAAAVSQGLMSGKALAWASLACTALAGVLRVLPPLVEAKVPSVPPLPLLLLVLCLTGCATCAKPAEAEGLYLAQHLSCVDRYATRAAIDNCRDAVDAKWGRGASGIAVTSTSKDGGDQ